MIDLAAVDFKGGLIPAVIRDARTGATLMVAWMNDEALKRTVESGETWFWSRSRSELWH
jgi:phosphoribosyl-AMP cyclohydrolase